MGKDHFWEQNQVKIIDKLNEVWSIVLKHISK